mmetsp:Transcript_34217/g.62009  ORF Transcript_34217/g.62009 Transcript_34217/m.62009 type:complete len:225 (+) Transcript_34217:234-908(+)
MMVRSRSAEAPKLDALGKRERSRWNDVLQVPWLSLWSSESPTWSSLLSARAQSSKSLPSTRARSTTLSPESTAKAPLTKAFISSTDCPRSRLTCKYSDEISTIIPLMGSKNTSWPVTLKPACMRPSLSAARAASLRNTSAMPPSAAGELPSGGSSKVSERAEQSSEKQLAQSDVSDPSDSWMLGELFCSPKHIGFPRCQRFARRPSMLCTWLEAGMFTLTQRLR